MMGLHCGSPNSSIHECLGQTEHLSMFQQKEKQEETCQAKKQEERNVIFMAKSCEVVLN